MAAEDVSWAKIRDADELSAHIVETPTRVPGVYKAYCGRRLTTEPTDDRPGGKTCETCYRIAGPR